MMKCTEVNNEGRGNAQSRYYDVNDERSVCAAFADRWHGVCADEAVGLRRNVHYAVTRGLLSKGMMIVHMPASRTSLLKHVRITACEWRDGVWLVG